MTPDDSTIQEWHVITCEYPPTIGGVSDYSFTLAAALGETRPVHVWCPAGFGPAPEAGNVTVHAEFDGFSTHDLVRLGHSLDRRPGPRRLFVHWVPQGFGYKSVNVGFALWIAERAWRRHDQVHLMIHEPFLPWSANPVHLVVSLLHRVMLTIAGWRASRIWLSTPAWKNRIRPYLRAQVPIEWLPVPAPTLPAPDPGWPREPARQQTVGHFGTHSPLVTPILSRALEVLLQQTDVRVLLAGRDSDTFRRSFVESRPESADRVEATGVLSPAAVVEHLRQCDVMLQPYPDGVTTRRTSTLTLLSLGLPTVTNAGHLSEDFWGTSGAVRLVGAPDGRRLGESAVSLLSDPAGCAALSKGALELYDRQFAPRHGVHKLNAAAWPSHVAA